MSNLGGRTEKTSAATKQAGDSPETFVLIHGLQNYKKLRPEDEFSFSSSGDEDAANPAAVLQV